ncbi:MAG: hypothetical protein BGO90_12705 [Legionella sp. 40-6]|nr:MAG: hypothetical protein BGO90_12705 [Legionella sp. 40-6]
MRLKSACEQRMKSCRRKNQNPLMETALFYVLMGTGLRQSEVVSLNMGQYRQKGLYDVLRHKSKRVSQKNTIAPRKQNLSLVFKDKWTRKHFKPSTSSELWRGISLLWHDMT